MPAVVPQARQLRPLTAAFPEVMDAVAAAAPAGTVVDGEVVVMSDGRVDFAAVRRPRPGPRSGTREVQGAARSAASTWSALLCMPRPLGCSGAAGESGMNPSTHFTRCIRHTSWPMLLR